jgi:hypothetical protein
MIIGTILMNKAKPLPALPSFNTQSTAINPWSIKKWICPLSIIPKLKKQPHI